MAEHFANEYESSLSGGINASQTSITVTSATGAPAANFRIRVDDEYMLVTGVSGTTFTVTRGVEGSTAASHADAATVTHVLTAGGLLQAVGAGVWSMAASSSQTLTSAQVNSIAFDTTRIDSGDGVIDLANNRFVVPYTGVFLALPHWMWEGTAPAAAGSYIEVRVNGTAAGPLIRNGPTAALGTREGSLPLSLAASDLITMHIHPGTVTGVTSRGNAADHLRTTFSLIALSRTA